MTSITMANQQPEINGGEADKHDFHHCSRHFRGRGTAHSTDYANKAFHR
jgi:hypothetical protein